MAFTVDLKNGSSLRGTELTAVEAGFAAGGGGRVDVAGG